ncbi:cell wall-binding repeat-containing protein [Halobacterium sp. R2-5]|uniref:cell wall-binding repeat-containing protein n=1 Tax=Halobacterium sp. R2-5 TaxID=2715751 RepID=UPI00141EE826|nr:cell wall-binding repeat-containing protein [Halobacterium sp. R2-5]NIC01055.1 cell wall-binding repeat-containing protein [Halobacterium sp. R2-5]
MSDRSRRTFLRDLAALPVGATLGGAALTYREVRSSSQQTQGGPSSADFDEGTVTSMTTRLAGSNDYETAAAFTQNVYTAINDHTRPGAAILINDSDLAAALPGVAFIHHPIDGAVLLTEQGSLPAVTREEIERLHPEGVHVDGDMQVYIIGGERYISNDVQQTVEAMGLKTRRIAGETPIEVAANADQYLSTIHANHRDTTFIADLDDLQTAIPAQSWNAHGGDGFLYIDGDRIPEATQQQLEARFNEAYMYLLGDESKISEQAARNLARFGHVQRIPRGSDPYELSVGFAGYKDIGRNQGWIFGEWPRNIGWGIAESGHNFIFANPDNWQTALPASVESHRGKHGPMLHVEQDTVPDAVKNYLTNLTRPHDSAPYDRKYNHGWIVGDTDQISQRVQAQLHAMLQEPKGDQ